MPPSLFRFGLFEFDAHSHQLRREGRPISLQAQPAKTLRKGTMTRPLFHLGNLKFFPAGSPLTRIEFQISAQSTTMQVLAPAPLLSAQKPSSRASVS
ncbi:MAG TPA: hypothetical protein VKT53_06150 [Candidatus Acidoferrum sp.]|nr:hypothetical protein [Candidatus Acidoferrum sp.]